MTFKNCGASGAGGGPGLLKGLCSETVAFPMCRIPKSLRAPASAARCRGLFARNTSTNGAILFEGCTAGRGAGAGQVILCWVCFWPEFDV